VLKLLCATDLLPKSEPALERAGQLAESLDAELLALHVVAASDSSVVLEQSLQVAIGEMHARTRRPVWKPEREPEVVVCAGTPLRLIVQTAQEVSAGLLVLGPHAGRGMRDALEGTIASKALASKLCPVLIVSRPPERRYSRVMLALDDSPASVAAIHAAEQFVITDYIDAMVINAFETPYRGILESNGTSAHAIEQYASGWLTDAAIRMRDLLKHHSGAFHRYDICVEEGRPASGILRAVATHRPDLLVLGTGSRGPLHRAFLGSVANEVMHRASCDVLIVPENGARDAITVRESPVPVCRQLL
jgi:nucleotide-binding universal stress UspA family protein